MPRAACRPQQKLWHWPARGEPALWPLAEFRRGKLFRLRQAMQGKFKVRKPADDLFQLVANGSRR